MKDSGTFERKNDALARFISDLLNLWEELADAGHEELLIEWQDSLLFQLSLYRKLALNFKTEEEIK